VDGLGVGDIKEVVLRDRQMLAADGIFVLIATVDSQTGKLRGSPDIISRGFVYLRESQELLKHTRKNPRPECIRSTSPMSKTCCATKSANSFSRKPNEDRWYYPSS
jgi:mRNA degradation ribonuclease J1/J2